MIAPVARVLLGGGFAAGGGAILAALGVPLGWLLGALIGSTIASNIAPPRGNSRPIRRAGQLLIGAATAGVITQDVLHVVLDLVPVMIAAAALANVSGLLLAFPFMRLAGVDRTTALLASLPAGMAEMASLAADLGVRVDVVTITHAIRVVLVVLIVPVLIGISGRIDEMPQAAGGSYWALLLCLIGGLALALLADRLKMLNAFVVVPMGLGVVLVASGLEVAPMPPALLVLAQILIGYSLGTRLSADQIRRLPRPALAGALCSLVLIGAMVLCLAPILAQLTGVNLISAMLGVAPGGLGEMIAAAKFSDAAVGIVAGFQFVRSFMTNMLVPPLLIRFAGPHRD